MHFVDSHCHLDYPELSDDLSGTLKRAENAGVGHFLTICVDLEGASRVVEIAESRPNIDATFGIHPHEAQKTLDSLCVDDLKVRLLKAADHPKIVGYGETGLDYFYKHSPKEQQQACFQAHIEAGLEKDLPLIVHTRDAEEHTVEQLKIIGGGQARGVIHCFTGTQYLAEEALDLGFYISVSGIVTFKRAEELRQVIQRVPLDRLLVETDSPYLAPIPHRGKPNQPAYVVHTAEKLAELKGVSLEDVKEKTTRNFYTLFNKIQ